MILWQALCRVLRFCTDVAHAVTQQHSCPPHPCRVSLCRPANTIPPPNPAVFSTPRRQHPHRNKPPATSSATPYTEVRNPMGAAWPPGSRVTDTELSGDAIDPWITSRDAWAQMGTSEASRANSAAESGAHSHLSGSESAGTWSVVDLDAEEGDQGYASG